tara:strand:+ start:846 stop:1472 length:627 start_codon:yes stop_codon:yes gene_type:complete
MAITKKLPVGKKKKNDEYSFLDFLDTTDDEIKPTKIISKKKKLTKKKVVKKTPPKPVVKAKPKPKPKMNRFAKELLKAKKEEAKAPAKPPAKPKPKPKPPAKPKAPAKPKPKPPPKQDSKVIKKKKVVVAKKGKGRNSGKYVSNSKMKCFMRKAKNGAVYRTCVAPKVPATTPPRKQLRGNPKLEGDRSVPYRTKDNRAPKTIPKKKK